MIVCIIRLGDTIEICFFHLVGGSKSQPLSTYLEWGWVRLVILYVVDRFLQSFRKRLRRRNLPTLQDYHSYPFDLIGQERPTHISALKTETLVISETDRIARGAYDAPSPEHARFPAGDWSRLARCLG